MLKKLAISTLLLCPTLSFALNKVEVQECFKKDIKKIETMTFEKPLIVDMFFLARQITYNRENYDSELPPTPANKEMLAVLDEELQSMKDVISSAQTCKDARLGFRDIKRNPRDNYDNQDYKNDYNLAFGIGANDSFTRQQITTEVVEEGRELLKEAGYPTAAKQLSRRHVFLASLIHIFDPGSEQAVGVGHSAYKKLVTADQLEQSARQKLKNDQLIDAKNVYKTVSKILK